MKYSGWLFVSLLILSVSGLAYAKVWENYDSGSEMFVVQFPSGPERFHSTMRVSPNLVLHHEEMKLAEEIPMANSKKHFMVRLDQTFGVPVGGDDTTIEQLDAIERRYRDHFKGLGGSVVEVFNIENGGYEGREFWIDLPGEEDAGGIGIRARVFFDGITKIQQMVLAPREYAGSHTTAQFFGQLNLFAGVPEEPGSIEEDWKEYPVDERGHFTFLLPEKAPPYLAEEPAIEVSGPRRTLSAIFFDPIYQHHIIFKAHVYDFGSDTIRDNGFTRFVLSNHVRRSEVRQREINADEFRGMRYWVPVKSPPGMPDVNYKFVKAYYINNFFDRSYIIVIETMASGNNIRKSSFEDMLSGSFNYERSAKAAGRLYDRGGDPITD